MTRNIFSKIFRREQDETYVSLNTDYQSTHIHPEVTQTQVTNEQREEKRKRISTLTLLFSLTLTLFSTLLLIFLTSDVDGRYIADLRDNWLTNAISDIYITQENACTYSTNYHGSVDLGHTTKHNDTSPFSIRFTKWENATICVRPILETTALNLLLRDDLGKCPENYIDCKSSGCYPELTTCPVTSITILPINEPSEFDPVIHYKYGTEEHDRKVYYRLISSTIDTEQTPLVQLRIDSVLGDAFGVCKSTVHKDPMKYDFSCPISALYEPIATYIETRSEFDFIKENLLTETYHPYQRDYEVKPALFSRKYISFLRPTRKSLKKPSENLSFFSFISPSYSYYRKDLDELNSSITEEESEISDKNIPMCDYDAMKNFLDNTSDILSLCAGVSELRSISFLVTILSMVAAFVLYTTRSKAMRDGGTFSLRLHGLASLFVFGASIIIYLTLITLSSRILDTYLPILTCLQDPIYTHLDRVSTAVSRSNILSFISMS